MAVRCQLILLVQLFAVSSLSSLAVDGVGWTTPNIRIPRGGGHRSWGRSSHNTQQSLNPDVKEQHNLKSPLAPIHHAKEDDTGYTYTFDLPHDLPDLSCKVQNSVLHLHGTRQLKKGGARKDGFLNLDFSISVPLQDDADISCITVKRSSKGNKLTVLAPKIGGTKTFKVEHQHDDDDDN